MIRADVVVVGGGPAGLAAAMACRLRGFEVVVLDPKTPPIDRPCGEGIMPEGTAVLERLGVDLRWSGCRALGGIRWIDADRTASGAFPAAPGIGIRRTALHLAMAERAARLGVRLEWGRAASGLREGAVETTAGPVEATWVVGADGRASRVRRWAGLPVRAPARGRIGVRRHFAVEPWTDLVEVYWGDRVEAYVTPVGDREVGVALMAEGRVGFDDLLGRFPSLCARLAGAGPASPEAGAGPFGHRCPRVTVGRVLLVGDATGTLDPITGEGLGLAFREAELLAEAVAAAETSRYEIGIRRLKRAPALLNRLVLLLADNPRLRRRTVAAIDGALFGRLLGLRGGDGPVLRAGVAPLVWRMLRTAA